MSAPKSLRFWRGICLAALLALPPLAQAQPPEAAPAQAVSLTLDQARGIGVAALRDGNPQLALQIGHGLLQADARDAFAHYLIASAHQQMRQAGDGRRAAARAYRHAGTPTEKFQAAQLAARLSVDDERMTLAQIWLRRSIVHAPDPAFRPQIEADYRQVRAMNPLEFNLRLSMAPSSNVNNGSDSPYALIDGVPVVGILDGLSQALSGMTASADLALSYRLNRTETSETRATARLHAARVWLSREARDLLDSTPGSDVSNGDFASTTVEAGLRHAFRPGGAEGNGIVSAELAAGQFWYGGRAYQSYARMGVGRALRLTDTTHLSLGAQVERREFDNSRNRPIDTLALQGTLSHRLGNGDRIGVTLAWRDSDSDTLNAVSTRKAAYLQYDMAEALGPARLSFTLGTAQTDFPDYRVGFIVVPGGRGDDSVFASLDMLFQRFDYAGFAPSLTLRAQKTRSNVSRFEATEFAVSFGIRSSF